MLFFFLSMLLSRCSIFKVRLSCRQLDYYITLHTTLSIPFLKKIFPFFYDFFGNPKCIFFLDPVNYNVTNLKITAH